MANDRLFLVHSKTKKFIIIGKHMGGSMYPPSSFLSKELDTFFDDTYCGSGENSGFYCVMENDAPDNIINHIDGIEI